MICVDDDKRKTNVFGRFLEIYDWNLWAAENIWDIIYFIHIRVMSQNTDSFLKWNTDIVLIS